MTEIIAREITNHVPSIPGRTQLFDAGWTDPTPESGYLPNLNTTRYTIQSSDTSLFESPGSDSIQFAGSISDVVARALGNTRRPWHSMVVSTAVPWRTFDAIDRRRLSIRVTTLLERYLAEVHDAYVNVAYFVSAATQEARINTEAQEAHAYLGREIPTLWREAEDEDFEDGYESRFGNEISRLIRKYGSQALHVLGDQIENVAPNAYVSAEALKSIGRVEDDRTRSDRRLLLERFLNHPHDIIREGAAFGLERLDDKTAIAALNARLAIEEDASLRKDLQGVIRFLNR